VVDSVFCLRSFFRPGVVWEDGNGVSIVAPTLYALSNIPEPMAERILWLKRWRGLLGPISK
jgi:hypothetical protein